MYGVIPGFQNVLNLIRAPITRVNRGRNCIKIFLLLHRMDRAQIQADYPLHWLVWNNDFEELGQALDEGKVVHVNYHVH